MSRVLTPLRRSVWYKVNSRINLVASKVLLLSVINVLVHAGVDTHLIVAPDELLVALGGVLKGGGEY